MKTKLYLLLILVITLNSCYTIKYTHSEVEGNIEKLLKNGKITKDDIIEQWGLPTHKKIEGVYEEWYYDLGAETTSVSSPSYTNTQVNVNQYNESANIKSRSYGGRTVTNTVNKCMIYTFKNGQPIKFETQGIDLTEKEINTPLTLGYLLGLTVLFIVLL